MERPVPSFFGRIGLAFTAFFRALGSASFAILVRDGAPALPDTKPEPAAKPESEAKPVPEPVAKIERPPTDVALQLLALLQREGRFVDFLQEDVTAFSDAEIGAAARVVHEGCTKALDDRLELEPIHDADEDTRVEIQAGFDPSAIRLTGNVQGDPPFHGTLRHRGWRATIRLPAVAEGHDASVVMPAEVEL